MTTRDSIQRDAVWLYKVTFDLAMTIPGVSRQSDGRIVSTSELAPETQSVVQVLRAIQDRCFYTGA
jgi:hypothetical protein